jgi:hypothetical protein
MTMHKFVEELEVPPITVDSRKLPVFEQLCFGRWNSIRGAISPLSLLQSGKDRAVEDVIVMKK